MSDRTPLEKLGWSVRTATTLPLAWSDPMAYVVGLTATDGCLTHGRRRSINFKSEDFELVSRYLALLGRTNRIGVELTREGNFVYHTQFGDARLTSPTRMCPTSSEDCSTVMDRS